MITLNGHRFLSRIGSRNSFPLYPETTIDPPINLQTQAALMSVFTLSDWPTNWETVWGIPLGSPTTFNLRKYGTHDTMVRT